MKPTKKLYLSTTDYKIAGVCGGIAEYFNMDATLVRLIYIGLSVFTSAFPGVILYLVLWFFVMNERNEDENDDIIDL